MDNDDISDLDRQITKIEKRLKVLDAERGEVLGKLEALRRQREDVAQHKTASPSDTFSDAPVTKDSPAEAKVALFRSLFRGREDMYPRKWESAKTGKSGYQPACRNDWVKGLCEKPRVKCSECPAREFLPVTDAVNRAHLKGADIDEKPYGGVQRDFTIGVYPLLPDETCWFIAADFDNESWQADVAAFQETCSHIGVPVAVERSRSG
ncbi:MAG: restriction endonuclease subunit R, partial [Kiritimatiellae bacterium]|nr:restriction endonuclease subunit R [Kiritimatiellia bacterium]